MNLKELNILLIEDNKDFAKLVHLYLERYKEVKFNIILKTNGDEGLHEALNNKSIEIILLDYFLPGENGIEVLRALRDNGIALPVIFLTVNKDYNIAIEAMRLGAADYIVKDEISTPVFPKILLGIREKEQLKEKYEEFEISRNRLEAIQKLAIEVTDYIEPQINGLERIAKGLVKKTSGKDKMSYVRIIDENSKRLNTTIVKLREIKDDKTVTYVKDIKMIDLS